MHRRLGASGKREKGPVERGREDTCELVREGGRRSKGKLSGERGGAKAKWGKWRPWKGEAVAQA